MSRPLLHLARRTSCPRPHAACVLALSAAALLQASTPSPTAAEATATLALPGSSSINTVDVPLLSVGEKLYFGEGSRALYRYEYDPAAPALGGRGLVRWLNGVTLHSALEGALGDPRDAVLRFKAEQAGQERCVDALLRRATIDDEVIFSFQGCLTERELPHYFFYYAQEFRILSGRLFFVLEGGLYVTDGAPNGARLLSRYDRDIEDLHVLGDELLFYAFASDGTGGLFRVGPDDTAPRRVVALPDVRFSGRFTQLGATLLGVATDRAHGTELWRTDGTPEGTALVSDLMAGPAGSAPAQLVAFGEHVYFQARGPRGTELHRSDGTSSGTQLVRDIHPTESSFPSDLTVIGDRLYFRADDGQSGDELWQSDGTAEGTRQVLDLARGRRSARPTNIAQHRGALYFWANDGIWDRALWRLRDAQPELIASEDSSYPRTTSVYDALGDVGAEDAVDWEVVGVGRTREILHLSYRTVDPIDIRNHPEGYQVYFDTDRRVATGYRVGALDAAIGAELLLKGATLYRYQGDGAAPAWQPLGAVKFTVRINAATLDLDTRLAPADMLFGSRVLFMADNLERDDYVLLDGEY